nr:reverse transcriptase domain-containing protein [Tanacetum cinerariifolium]
MTHLVASMTLDSESISPEGFLPSILLLAVIIVVVAIVVTVVLVVVDAIIRVIVVIGGVSFIIKLFCDHCNYAEENKVTFATGTLTDDSLSGWNAYAQPIGIEQANKITWTELKRLLTNKYCPRTKVKKMEDEFYSLIVKGNDLKTYVRRF